MEIQSSIHSGHFLEVSTQHNCLNIMPSVILMCVIMLSVMTPWPYAAKHETKLMIIDGILAFCDKEASPVWL